MDFSPTLLGGLGVAAAVLLIIMIVVIFETGVRLSYSSCGSQEAVSLEYQYQYSVDDTIIGGYDTGCHGLVVHKGGIWCLENGYLHESGDYYGESSGGVGNRAWLYNPKESCTYLFTQKGTRWFKNTTLENTDGPQSGDFCFHDTDNPPFLYAGDVDMPSGHFARSITGTATGFVLLTEIGDTMEYYLWAYGTKAFGGLLLELERYPSWIRATDLGTSLLVMYQEGPNVVTYIYYKETDKWIPSQTLYGTHGKVGFNCNTMALVQDNLTTKLYKLDRASGLYLTGTDAKTYPGVDVLIISNTMFVTRDSVYRSGS